MDYEISIGETTASLRRMVFFLPDVSDGFTPKTGQAGNLSARISKNGGATAVGTGSFTEIDPANMPGMYYYEATTTEVNTEGWLLLVASCVNCVTQRIAVRIGVSNSDQIDAIPTTAEIDTALSGTHGSNSWEDKEGVGSGANIVTLTIRDSVTFVGIPDVIVQVFNSSLTTLLRWGLTDANGQIISNLDDGTYKIMLRKHGAYAFSNPETLTVSGVTSDTYDGVAFSPSAPPSPETCVLYGTTHDAQEQPKSVEVIAELVEAKHFTTTGIQVIKGPISAWSRVTDGYWEMVLTRSGEYTGVNVVYSVHVGGISMGEYLIPDQANVNFADLTPYEP